MISFKVNYEEIGLLFISLIGEPDFWSKTNDTGFRFQLTWHKNSVVSEDDQISTNEKKKKNTHPKHPDFRSVHKNESKFRQIINMIHCSELSSGIIHVFTT